MEKDFVITGVGFLGNWGVGKKDFIRFLRGEGVPVSIEEVDFDAYIDVPSVRRADYISCCALTAAKFALEDAGMLPISKEKSNRIGAILGTVHGALYYTIEYHASLVLGDPKLASPLLFSDSVANAAVSHISTGLGIRGYSTTVPGYCGVTQALKLGIELIQQGVIDVCLVGGADVNHDFLTKAYRGCLCSPELIVNTFGGSGCLVIESLSHAIKRKAKIYAKIDGVSIITASYAVASCYNISPLQDLLNEANIELRDNDCFLNMSFDDEDSLCRRDLFLPKFSRHHFISLDCSSSFGYGFAAAEAFQIILGVLGVDSEEYLSSFKGINTNKPPNRIFITRTTLAGTNSCALFSHCS
ncbi:MAG: hypothetical protein COX96_06750 [Candidatus Omnitrophica bacterium CG_4_10_14_0_2_um_filter_44_9]|nr:MAG: hypothetical protein AUJ70_04055 [Candidatus Omnitrophica bacterium CG1_02_40_15]PIY81972.1 MAG: hypothetical protein COY78_09235 [Candidatus Omnitrophica bacterium CG_4_10_14_0_8_um_filter_44_12]PIZ83802.1 MAG: hypothetical protein COX96_06750 [Candidatus Omnitrophica bacterium CG_4_10_14_0_2_um_filter_44_9]